MPDDNRFEVWGCDDDGDDIWLDAFPTFDKAADFAALRADAVSIIDSETGKETLASAIPLKPMRMKGK